MDGVEERLKPGPKVIHHGLFYLLLLVWYTGARREELAKLMLDDVEERHSIQYLLIRPTITGQIKNKSARRVIAIANELIRLSFVDPFEIAALLVQHAPHQAGSDSPPHVHALLAGPRRLTPLGFSEWVTPLATDKVHALVGNAFRQFQADSRQA